MRYIKGLPKEQIKILQKISKESKYYQVRQRAHCIQLSAQGYQISELMNIFQVSRNTIYNWLNNWEKSSLAGLYNKPGKGRKRILDEKQELQVKEWVKETPKNLNVVQAKVQKQLGLQISKDTIKRTIKSMEMGWKRIKKIVGGSPVPEFYEKKVKELEELLELERNGELEIRYVDESGFSLIPCVPYAWQEKGKQVTVKSKRSKRLSVLGFLTKDNQLECYTFENSINSDVIVAWIDDFCKNLKKKPY